MVTHSDCGNDWIDCVLYDDGFTPRIPGGAGSADAVFMPGLE